MFFLLRQISKHLARKTPQQLQRIGGRLGLLLGRIVRYRRSEIIATLAGCFPEWPPERAQHAANGMYQHLGLLLLEGIRTDQIAPEQLLQEVETSAFEKALRILDQKRGLLILTAHIGNFEMLGMLAAFKGAPLTVVVKQLKPKWLNNYWVSTRGKFGVKMLPAKHSYRYCREALKQNGILGFILDQNMKRNRGIFVDFFGRPACTSPGLALLSAQTGAPVLPAFIVRLPDGRHHVHALDPLPPPPNTDKTTIRQATQEYTTIIENFIRQYPEQWIWLHRRWRTQPEPDNAA